MDCKKNYFTDSQGPQFIFSYFNGSAVSLQPRGLENDQKCLGFRDSTPLKSTKFGYKFPPKK